MNISDDYIENSAEKIRNFLVKNGFKNVKVENVSTDEVKARTTIGFDPEEEKDEFEVYYRIQIHCENRDEILDTRGDIMSYFRDTLIEMDMSNAPDTIFIESDNPPRHINKPLVCYVRSVL